MRVKIENKSSRPDETVIALAEFAATFFPHVTGIIPVTVKNSRRMNCARGVCRGRRACVIWIPLKYEFDSEDKRYPKTFKQMHYFRHANQDDVKTVTLADWKEELLAIIAHEMEHTTRGNRQMRRSRQEVHAWNREVEVLEEYRKPEVQASIQKRIEEILASRLRKIDKAQEAKQPEAKIVHLSGLKDKWLRKLKLAQTKIRKLNIRIKYFERKSAANKSEVHSAPQAAL